MYDACIFIALSFLMTASLTQFIKVYVGRPRPAFFSICQYPKIKIGDMEMYGVPGRVADISKCTASVVLKMFCHYRNILLMMHS